VDKETALSEMNAELRAIREAREKGNKNASELQGALTNLQTKVDNLAQFLPLDPAKLEADEKWMKFLDKIAETQVKAAFKANGDRNRLGNGQLIDETGFTFDQRHVLTTQELERYYDSTTFTHIRNMQNLADEALIIGSLLHAHAAKRGETNEPLPNRYIKSTKAYKQLMTLRAMDTLTATEGLEWIPVEFSGQLYDIVAVSLKVAANFPMIAMPAPTFKLPIATTDDVAFLVPENITDNFLTETNKVPTLTPGTANVTLTAKKLGALTVFSEELNEDSIIAIIPFLRNKLGNAIANAIERATLDGDTTATHMDNDVTVASDARKAWNGIRKDCIASATTYDVASTAGGGEATFTAQDLLRLRGLIDPAFAEDPEQLAYVVSVNSMLKMMAFTEMVTVDKLGPNATIVRGQVGRIWGAPVLTSKYARTNVAATGVNTGAGPNTLAVVYLTNKNGYIYGNRRGVTIKSAESVWSDQGLMVVTWRGDFQKLRPGSKVSALGINVPTT
jgi:HK97 family phage major capsid protein